MANQEEVMVEVLGELSRVRSELHQSLNSLKVDVGANVLTRRAAGRLAAIFLTVALPLGGFLVTTTLRTETKLEAVTETKLEALKGEIQKHSGEPAHSDARRQLGHVRSELKAIRVELTESRKTTDMRFEDITSRLRRIEHQGRRQ